MTAEAAKNDQQHSTTATTAAHHVNHHHPDSGSKVHLQSIERLTTFPVIQSAHSYYEKIKESNILIKWTLYPYETGVWLTVQTAMPVVAFFGKPVGMVDSMACKGLDVLEANLPIVTYPPELMYSMTKDYVSSKLVTPVLKRADSVKQLSINCREIAATGLNQAIDAADKYVDKYLPDITDTTDNPPEKTENENQPEISETTKKIDTKSLLKIQNASGKEKRRRIDRLHVYSDGHGQQLADKLKKRVSKETDVYVSVTNGASSSYLVPNAIRGAHTFTKSDTIVLIAGMDDMAFGGNVEKLSKEYLKNIDTFARSTTSTTVIVCPILPQFDLPLNGVINENIVKINNQLILNLAGKEHVFLLNTSKITRKYFTKSGLFMNKKGKQLLAYIIVAAASSFRQSQNEQAPPANPDTNSDSKTVHTMQHVNQFGRKLQRRLTLRTIAEAKALRQQGVATVNCLKYLLELLARDPKEFMNKMKEVWAELSKDEPENQLPPSNLEQLIVMLTREVARRVVHLINYMSARFAVLGARGLHVAHIAALHAFWWADNAIKLLKLEPVVDKVGTQLGTLQTVAYGISLSLWVRLLELLKFVRSIILKETEEQSIENKDKITTSPLPVIMRISQASLTSPPTALPSSSPPPTTAPAPALATAPAPAPALAPVPATAPATAPIPPATPSPKNSTQNGDFFTNSESSSKVTH